MDEQISPVPAHHNVLIPFAADIPDGVFPGKAIFLKGVVEGRNSEKYQRFSIDLCCGKLFQGDHQDNKALHINFRFDQAGISLFSKPDNDVVLNSLVNNVWGMEQRCGNPFELGKPFTIRFLMLRDYFKISVNKKHLTDFIHRLPLDTIQCIYVQGCVRIDVIEYQGTRPGTTPLNSPAITNVIKPIEVTELDVPFSFRMPEGGFLVPRKMHVMLIPAPNASSFSVNFFCKDEYLFQMRVDFPGANGADKRGAVVRNNTFGGQWQREERQMARFPFTPGMQSEMKIVAAMGGLKVLIDGSHFCDFHYYSTGPIPTQTTETTIVGDVSIQKFEFWNKSS